MNDSVLQQQLALLRDAWINVLRIREGQFTEAREKFKNAAAPEWQAAELAVFKAKIKLAKAQIALTKQGGV
jgi:hypothetical protein